MGITYVGVNDHKIDLFEGQYRVPNGMSYNSWAIIGGKVAVMAVNLANCKTPNLFSYAKRDLLVKIFRKLGGDCAVPVRNTDRANVMLVANDDGQRLFMEAVNLSCDPAEQFVFETMPPYAGGKVEILDGATWRDVGATWNGNRFTVNPPVEIDVYGTLIMRIAK